MQTISLSKHHNDRPQTTVSKALPLAIAVVAIFASAPVFGQVTIDYGSPQNIFADTSTGAPVTASTFTFELGVFPGVQPTTAASLLALSGTGFEALPGQNPSAWWDDPSNGQGEIGGSFMLADNNTFTVGQQVYLWGFNGSTIANSSQWILFTNSSVWLIPSVTSAIPSPQWTINPSTGTTIVDNVGTLNASGTSSSNPYFTTSSVASVPEPGSFTLIALGFVAIFGLETYRKRLSGLSMSLNSSNQHRFQD